MKEIFVFGSNRAGLHAGGAARYAFEKLNAQWGVGEGLTGNTYALPTVDRAPAKAIGEGDSIGFGDVLSLDEIAVHVNKFLGFAELAPGLKFRVTRIGCGIAGFTDKEIAPLFVGASANCIFDITWKPFLGNGYEYFTF